MEEAPKNHLENKDSSPGMDMQDRSAHVFFWRGGDRCHARVKLTIIISSRKLPWATYLSPEILQDLSLIPWQSSANRVVFIPSLCNPDCSPFL